VPDRRAARPQKCDGHRRPVWAEAAENWRRPLKGMKILAVLDGSRCAETVLPKAVELVRQHPDATVVVARAVDPATVPRDGGNQARVAAMNEAAEYLGEVAARLRSEGVRPVTRSVWYAAAGPAIAELARTVKPDVILMAADSPPGTSARGITAEEEEMIHA
jgi:hypothetical protein